MDEAKTLSREILARIARILVAAKIPEQELSAQFLSCLSDIERPRSTDNSEEMWLTPSKVENIYGHARSHEIS